MYVTYVCMYSTCADLRVQIYACRFTRADLRVQIQLALFDVLVVCLVLVRSGQTNSCEHSLNFTKDFIVKLVIIINIS